MLKCPLTSDPNWAKTDRSQLALRVLNGRLTLA